MSDREIHKINREYDTLVKTYSGRMSPNGRVKFLSWLICNDNQADIIRQHEFRETAMQGNDYAWIRAFSADFSLKFNSDSLNIIQENKNQLLDVIFQDATRKLDEAQKAELNKLTNTQTKSRINYFYLFLLCFFGLICIFLVKYGYADGPEISIEYNVGEIIGGLLAGGGAIVAGTAYAYKTLSENKPESRENPQE